MIAYIHGKLTVNGVGWVVIDVNGLGYRIFTPSTTKLPAQGQELKLHTHMAVKEDGIQIYGFVIEEELECFLALLDVAGVGPKAALAVVSHLEPAQLRAAIAAGDVNQLVKAPGVGKKTAQRILLELKDKLKGPALAKVEVAQRSSQSSNSNSLVDDTIVALLSLGYVQAEAREAVRKVLNNDPVADVSTLIRLTLKELAPAK